MKVTVLGEGAWGTAVATLLAENGYNVCLWCYHESVAEEIETKHINSKYLPGIELNKKIVPTVDIKEAIVGTQWIFEAIPVQFLRSVLEDCAPYYDADQIWVILSKGIENKTLMLPTQILDEVLCNTVCKAVFSGPSFAHDLAHKQLTAATIAVENCQTAYKLQELLANTYFKPYNSLDIIGVQVGGALKNVITLCIGMLDGAGYTDNAKAFVLTQGLHEIVEVATALGGSAQTLYGLSGLGDLVLSAMGEHSRNLEVGKRLGRGEKLKAILEDMNSIPEGVDTTRSLYQLQKKLNLNLPICTGVYNILFKDKTLKDLLNTLICEPSLSECQL